MTIRVGIGYDIHQFVAGRRLVLGGVEILAERGLLGHSDADVLTHALMDALLGAAGLGDIGRYFPPSDARWKDADSLALLGRVVTLLREHGWRVGNVDVTLVLEQPKVGPYVPAMRERLGPVLGIDPALVGVKATTNEALGAIGRGEGAAAHAVALLVAIEAP